MIKDMFYMLFLAHILGDFCFQTENMVQKKKKTMQGVWEHVLEYGLVTGIFFLLFMPGMEWEYRVFFIICHTIIDVGKYIIYKQGIQCRSVRIRKTVANKKYIFILDQSLHLLFILVIVYLLNGHTGKQLYCNWVKNISDTFEIAERFILTWVLRILLLHKPANILISNILSTYKPVSKTSQRILSNNKEVSEESSETDDRNAGRLIGTLERLIMVIFVSLEQYSAIGLVLTAKSIARYDKISKDQFFAEYYLLGTLLSTIIAVSVAIIL